MLFPNLAPIAAPKGIDLRCCDVREMLAMVRGARLVCADPPWQYSVGAAGKGMAQPELNGIYECMSDADIAAILDVAFDSAAPDARLAVWTTHPKLMEWIAAGHAGPRWRYVSGGSWAKLQQVGVGYHWRGRTEPVHLFAKGAAGRCRAMLENGHESPPGDHSEKPVAWLREWLRAWTDPGDLVVDIFAGLAPLARACYAEGRRYVGAEIDPERHDKALARLAAYRGTL
jgi:hypothetical protein